MNGREVIWDPLRKKEVLLTPEEKVRQWCISVLIQHCKVPAHMMMSEAGFKLGEKQFRADILVYDRKAQPLMEWSARGRRLSLLRRFWTRR